MFFNMSGLKVTLSRAYFRYLLRAIPARNAPFDFFWHFLTLKLLNLYALLEG